MHADPAVVQQVIAHLSHTHTYMCIYVIIHTLFPQQFTEAHSGVDKDNGSNEAKRAVRKWANTGEQIHKHKKAHTERNISQACRYVCMCIFVRVQKSCVCVWTLVLWCFVCSCPSDSDAVLWWPTPGVKNFLNNRLLIVFIGLCCAGCV